MRPMAVTVVHTDGVDLFFVSLDTVRGTNVISKDPGFTSLAAVKHVVAKATSKHRSTHKSEVPINGVLLDRDELSHLI